MLGIRSKRWLFYSSWVLLILFCSLLVQTPVATAATADDIQSSLEKLPGYYNQVAEYNDWETLGLRWAGVECGSKYTPEEPASASDYARTILGSIAAAKQDEAVVSSYVYNLVKMQQPDGSFETGGNITLNQTIWAVIALDFADINGFDVNYNRNDAVNYICSKQDSSGGFDESDWGVDIDSTAHALIALAEDKGTNATTTNNALAYLQGQQMDTGGFGGWGSESPDSTAAVIEALMALGIDPLADDWLKNGNNMVDALLAYQSDQGWFVNSWETSSWNDPTVPNRMSTRNALLALGDLVRGQSKYSSILPETGVPGGNAGNGGSTGQGDPGQQSSALVTVRGDTEKGTILEYTSYQWKGSCTALAALKGVLEQNGISHVISGEYVRSIAGLAEKKKGYPLSGWLFRINGVFSGVGAGSAIIRNGDQVEWLYTLDGGKDVGATVLIDKKPQEPKPEQINQVMNVISQYQQQLSGLKEKNMIVNKGERMLVAEVEQLCQELKNNKVDISQETGREGGILADSEVLLNIPENALTQSTQITIKESSEDKPTNFAVKIQSSIYEFGPDGVQFNQPVTIAIKFAFTDDINLEELAPAWYDQKTEQWLKIPAIIDLKNGLVIFQIDHFTTFALIESRDEVVEKQMDDEVKQLPQVSFPDLDVSFDWAREAIESLAAKGVIRGTGIGFEPARNISRAEMLALLLQAKGTNLERCELKYTDTKANDWYYDYVATANKQGWISGYPDSTFRPNASISRNEAVCLVNRIFPINKGIVFSGKSGFSDQENIPEWVQQAAGSLQKRGIISGYPDGSFSGESNLTRAEAAIIVYKAIRE